MKKLFLYVFLGLLLSSNAFAATVEDFKCTPKMTSQKEQAKKDLNFRIISTQSEMQKFVTYNNKDDVAMAWFYNEKLLKQVFIAVIKSIKAFSFLLFKFLAQITEVDDSNNKANEYRAYDI